MGNCTIFQMFGNLGEADKQGILQQMFQTNSRSQILFLTDIFRKLTLGAPEHLDPLEVYVVGRWRLLPNQR